MACWELAALVVRKYGTHRRLEVESSNVRLLKVEADSLEERWS